MTLAEQFIQQGYEEGRKQGLLIGQIQALEYFLGRSETPVGELVPRTLEELQTIVDALERARSRG
jgi:flagellar biosynthesis/type III secretory pathway protein FliH